MEQSDYLKKKCPTCGKILFEYKVDTEFDLRVWCRHCHDLILVKLDPRDSSEDSKI